MQKSNNFVKILNTVLVRLTIIETQFYHFRHCVCRRIRCEHGDICQKHSDCGRDKWNRRGKCVITKYPKNGGFLVQGDMMFTIEDYQKRIGVSHWKKNK